MQEEQASHKGMRSSEEHISSGNSKKAIWRLFTFTGGRGPWITLFALFQTQSRSSVVPPRSHNIVRFKIPTGLEPTAKCSKPIKVNDHNHSTKEAPSVFIKVIRKRIVGINASNDRAFLIELFLSIRL
jgi:hypothetical protein